MSYKFFNPNITLNKLKFLTCAFICFLSKFLISSWRSLAAVRRRHVRMSRHCEKAGQVGMISQKDMALTQFGFIGFILIKGSKLGMKFSDKNEEGFVHFWRVIGYMIGIEDRFNVCTESVAVTKKRLQIIEREEIRPCLENAPSMFHDMANALVSGLWSFNPLLDTEAFIYITKRLAGCEGYYYFESEIEKDGILPIKMSPSPDTIKQNGIEAGHVKKTKREKLFTNFVSTLNLYSRFILFVVIMIHQYCMMFFLVRWYFNGQLIVSRFLIKYFPFLAFHRFGFRDSYVRIFRGDSIN